MTNQTSGRIRGSNAGEDEKVYYLFVKAECSKDFI